MNMGRKLELINPANSEKFRELPCHTREDAETLLIKARMAQGEWKHSTLEQRIELVQGAMDYFQENIETISRDIALQMGKPIRQSRNEVKGMIHRAEVCCD